MLKINTTAIIMINGIQDKYEWVTFNIHIVKSLEKYRNISKYVC